MKKSTEIKLRKMVEQVINEEQNYNIKIVDHEKIFEEIDRILIKLRQESTRLDDELDVENSKPVKDTVNYRGIKNRIKKNITTQMELRKARELLLYNLNYFIEDAEDGML